MKVEAFDYLYRFRPLSRLLEKGELENQQIYFAKPEQLNDPMEGFRDIFWRGDEIVWRNLFRHFLLCFERALSLIMIMGEEHPFGWDHIPVFNHGDTSFTPQQQTKHDEIIKEFFQDENVRACVDALANRSTAVRRYELTFYLRVLQPFAASVILRCYQRHGLIPPGKLDVEHLAGFSGGLSEIAKAIGITDQAARKASKELDDLQLNEFFSAIYRVISELDLIHLYNGTFGHPSVNWNFVFIFFCYEYVDKIEILIYPKWYAACFMRDCRNSAIWGSYGENHTAVCLKFKVNNEQGLPLFGVNRQIGTGSSRPIHGKAAHPFLKIRYDNEPMPVDFFRSMGQLPIPVLQKYWYSDETGKRSPCADDIFNSEDTWRARYWEMFEHGITRKLNAWRYEEEYRLVLTSMVLDFRDDTSRVVTYDFKDLEGIIFGIKTDTQSKLTISKIIEEKCKATNRTDFKFYQAYYSQFNGTIEHAEMPFLKFKT